MSCIKKFTLSIITWLILPIMIISITGCGRNMSSNVYSSGATSGKVVSGKIVSARAVQIKDSQQLGQNQAGALAGGLAGGLVGNQFGKGSGNTATTIGGAVLGGVAGAFAEDALSTSSGFEYIVKLDRPHTPVSTKGTHSTKKVAHKFGKTAPSDDINDAISIASTETDMISIIQTDELMLQVGQKVLVVFSNDRPRVVAQ